MSDIVNKVAQSGLITIDLEDMYPEGDRVLFDISHLLFEGLLLREKDFREFIAQHEWSGYASKHVALYCSTDAIIPRWAWMLLATALSPFARTIVVGDLESLESHLYMEVLRNINPEDYRDQRVVIKGCSNKPVPAQAYARLTEILRPIAKSILYGEPCSTVPVYKRGS